MPINPTKSLKDQLRRFLERMQSGGRGPLVRGHHWFNRGAQLVALSEEEDAEYGKLVRLALRELAPADEISVGAVVQHLDDAIMLARSPLTLDLRGRAQRARDHALVELCRPIRNWNVHFPIGGVYEDCLPYKFGFVTMLPASLSLAEEVLPEDRPEDLPFRKAVRRFARQEMGKHFGNGPRARVCVRALEDDGEAARALALAELELTMDVVNFFADIFRPGVYRARVELAANMAHGLQASCIAMDGLEPGGVGTAVTGSLDNVWLPDLDSDDARKVGLGRVDKILSSKSRTEIDLRLLAALRWSGHGTAAVRLTDKFLAFMMALESLVNGPTKIRDIARTVESRAGQLLSDDNSKSRAVSELQRLYDVR